MILLAALLCNYGRGFCLIDVGTEGCRQPQLEEALPPRIPMGIGWPYRILSAIRDVGSADIWVGNRAKRLNLHG